jgi:tetratricopeptide (TPR) repeat protein
MRSSVTTDAPATGDAPRRRASRRARGNVGRAGRRVARPGRLAWLAGVFLLAWVAPRLAADSEEGWIKVYNDNFTILTPAGEGPARKWAVELEQFRRGLQSIVPVDPERLRPVTVVLFRNDKAMEPYAPLEHGKPARVGGLFVRANDLNTIMLSLAHDAGETRHTIFHEAVHWHLSALDTAMPLWLAEGIADVYATFELPDATSYAFGEPLERYVVMLRASKLLPLAQLLSVDRDSLLYNEGTRANIFYAEAWAFVHYLFYGEGSPGRGAVMRYLELLKTAPNEEEAFQTAFGGSYAELELRLRRYIQGGSYRKHLYARAAEDLNGTLQVELASRAERELAKGSLLFGTRTPDDAEPHLRLASSLEPGDPRAWELLGHIGIARRDFSAASASLSRAVMAGSQSYLVFHHLAVSRLPQPLVPTGPFGGFDPAEIARAAADYRHAIELAPSHVPSYEGLAGLVYGAESFDPADAALLARGLAQAPGNTMIEAGIAAVAIRAGRADEGRAHLDRLIAHNPDSADAGMKYARSILADLTINAELAEIDRLAKANRYSETLPIIDRALARTLDRPQRRVMADTRRRMEQYQYLSAAVDLANHGEPGAAKRQLEVFIDTDAEPSAKQEAARILSDLARNERRLLPQRP